MGGRGASSGGPSVGGATGRLNPGDIVATTSLVSARERKKTEVDQTLRVARNVYEKYGVNV